jgi:hypothetical protein
MATTAHLHRPPRPTTARAPHPPMTSLLVAAVLVLIGSVMTVVAVGFWVTATSVTATVIRVVDSDNDLVVRWTDPRTGEDRTNQIMGYDDEIELVERLALAGPLEGELVEHFDLGFWTATGLAMLTTGAGLGLRWRWKARELHRQGSPLQSGSGRTRARGVHPSAATPTAGVGRAVATPTRVAVTGKGNPQDNWLNRDYWVDFLVGVVGAVIMIALSVDNVRWMTATTGKATVASCHQERESDGEGGFITVNYCDLILPGGSAAGRVGANEALAEGAEVDVHVRGSDVKMSDTIDYGVFGLIVAGSILFAGLAVYSRPRRRSASTQGAARLAGGATPTSAGRELEQEARSVRDIAVARHAEAGSAETERDTAAFVARAEGLLAAATELPASWSYMNGDEVAQRSRLKQELSELRLDMADVRARPEKVAQPRTGPEAHR